MNESLHFHLSRQVVTVNVHDYARVSMKIYRCSSAENFPNHELTHECQRPHMLLQTRDASATVTVLLDIQTPGLRSLFPTWAQQVCNVSQVTEGLAQLKAKQNHASHVNGSSRRCWWHLNVIYILCTGFHLRCQWKIFSTCPTFKTSAACRLWFPEIEQLIIWGSQNSSGELALYGGSQSWLLTQYPFTRVLQCNS